METKVYLIVQLWSQQFNSLFNWNIEIKIHKWLKSILIND